MQAGAATPTSSFFLPFFHPPKSFLSSIPLFTLSEHPPRLPKKPRNRKISVRVSTGQPSTTSSEPTTSTGSILSASDVVKEFYKRINARELGSVEELIADACVYEDLVFARPFVGRQAILDFFKEFTSAISSDLQFVIDDISAQDSSAIGVTWHLEWKGRPFPFSKGCSFYRLELINGRRQIVVLADTGGISSSPPLSLGNSLWYAGKHLLDDYELSTFCSESEASNLKLLKRNRMPLEE